MTQHEQPNRAQHAQLAVTLEFVPEQAGTVDPVATNTMGRTVKQELEQAGYAVESPYTGQRGDINVLLQTWIQLTTLTQAVGTDIAAQGTNIGIIANLVTIFTPLLPLLGTIFKASAQHPIKITVSIDGAPITIEAANLQEAEAALTLAKRFHTTHPHTNPDPHKSKLKAQIPSPQKRRR